MKSFILLIIFTCFITTQSLSQSSDQINISGKAITFNSDQSTLSVLFPDMGPIESDHNFLEVYEFSDEISGGYGEFYFYENKLISINFIANNNEPYPVSDDLEKMLEGHLPISEKEEEEFDAFVQTFDVNGLYIQRTSTRMNTDYFVIPIEILNEIRKTRPDYLFPQFK